MPFGVWEVSEAFNRALEFEEEQDEQILEEEIKSEDEFFVRLSSSKTDPKDACQSVSKLVITTDDISAAFTDSYLMSEETEKVGLVAGPYCSHKDGNSVHQNSLWDKTCFLYKLDDKSNILICQMKQTIEAKYMFDWVGKVMSRQYSMNLMFGTLCFKDFHYLSEIDLLGMQHGQTVFFIHVKHITDFVRQFHFLKHSGPKSISQNMLLKTVI